MKATEMIEKKLHFHLSFLEKLQLKAHQMMCEACTRYEIQSQLIDKSLSRDPPVVLSEAELNALKKTIADKLENSQNTNDYFIS